MPYDMTWKREQDILKVKATGIRDMASVSAVAQEIMKISKHHRASRILVDVRKLSGRLSMFEAVHLITRVFPEIKKYKIFKKAAIVDGRGYRTQYEFFETFARNRGYNLMLFDDEMKASGWLESES